MKLFMVNTLRSINFDTVGDKVEELKGVNPQLLRDEVNGHVKYLDPALKAAKQEAK